MPDQRIESQAPQMSEKGAVPRLQRVIVRDLDRVRAQSTTYIAGCTDTMTYRACDTCPGQCDTGFCP